MKILYVDGARPNFIKLGLLLEEAYKKFLKCCNHFILDLWDGKAAERITRILVER